MHPASETPPEFTSKHFYSEEFFNIILFKTNNKRVNKICSIINEILKRTFENRDFILSLVFTFCNLSAYL